MTFIACDPGIRGVFAVFEPNLIGLYPMSEWKEMLSALSGATVIGAIEKNHGIQGQSASSTYAQGFSAGLAHGTMELVCAHLLETPAQTWMRNFKVPPGLEKSARKKWIHAKASTHPIVAGMKVPLYAADAVALGITYLECPELLATVYGL